MGITSDLRRGFCGQDGNNCRFLPVIIGRRDSIWHANSDIESLLPKQHHFVPQNHLRRFAGADGKVQVFDKATGNVFPASEKNVGGEMNFSGTQEIEIALAAADSKFKVVIDDVLRSLKDDLFIPEHKQALAPHVALQAIRTREMRDTIAGLGTELILEMAEREGHPVDRSRSKVRMNPAYAQYYHLAALLDPDKGQKLARFFYNEFIWIVGVNETEMPLWTSDAPVITKSHSDKGKTWREKTLLSGAERQFALSPKYLLILFMRKFAKHLENKEGAIIRLTERQVMEHNILLVAQCTRQVYSPSLDFTVAERFCRDNPELCDPSRKRVKIERF